MVIRARFATKETSRREIARLSAHSIYEPEQMVSIHTLNWLGSMILHGILVDFFLFQYTMNMHKYTYGASNVQTRDFYVVVSSFMQNKIWFFLEYTYSSPYHIRIMSCNWNMNKHFWCLYRAIKIRCAPLFGPNIAVAID